jgi:hypothetical protein
MIMTAIGNCTLQNASLAVTLNGDRGTFTVLDKRNGQQYEQQAVDTSLVCQGVSACGAKSVWLHKPSGMHIQMTLQLDADAPEFTVTLSAEGPLDAPLAFPHPFVTGPGSYLVVPMNEGISFPVDDPAITGQAAEGLLRPRWHQHGLLGRY